MSRRPAWRARLRAAALEAREWMALRMWRPLRFHATAAQAEIARRARMRRSARALQPARVRDEALRAAGCLLVCCVRNERVRIPAFLAHYRRLGVAHFLFIDNESDDGLAELLAGEADCSRWLARGSYKAANFGMDWCNLLLARHGVGKWCLTVDPDEFLVFPWWDERGLAALTRYMDGCGQPSLHAPMIDAYGPGHVSETLLHEGQSPFEACPWFDRYNLTQRYDERRRNFWIQGGVRLRCFNAGHPALAPALNKVPLVRWERGLRYVSSMHHLNRPRYNCTVLADPQAVSGVLFHFKYVHLLGAKAREELARREHYAGSREYRAYLAAGDPILHDPAVSVRWRDWRQLRELGFVQGGGWY
ncbi:MAG TPA: glycosyltransferase family 2 protein [Burkholderiaceae bacterium]|nr:glycosyltransferase family 2 protein [Burkholderiaceae bacterium]